jgi:hypothetical protein
MMKELNMSDGSEPINLVDESNCGAVTAMIPAALADHTRPVIALGTTTRSMDDH